MERGRKRKATGGASSEAENGASKRQRTAVDQETPQSTTRVGLQLVEQLKSAKDKTGRLIADLFVHLPDKRELPDYYQTIRLPISIQTIQDKLERNGYATLSAVEGDAKRMVANAKQYNDDKSVVYQDAERIRKLLSNFMTRHNPAYKTPNYVAYPTPIPGEDDGPNTSSVPSTREHSEQPRKITLSLKARKSSVAAASPPAAQDSSDPTDFSAKSFQQAQEHIVNGLIHHTDDDGLDVFQPFVNLPPRSLTDYFKVIKKPMSLSAVKKRVRGQHGREAPTMVSDFKNWDAFEEEVSYIWRNAKEYNEDGSDMFNLAGHFEQVFKERLAIAREHVDEPAQPKIKLSAPRPKPVLHLGIKSSPAPRATPAKEDEPAANAQRTPAPTALPSRSNSQVPAAAAAAAAAPAPAAAAPAPEQPQSATASSPSATAAVKTEKSVVPSPSLSTVRPQSAAPEAKQSPKPPTSMPPPALRGPSGSPHPSSLSQQPQVPAYMPPPPTFVDQYARTKPLADALLPALTITTNSQLKVSTPFRIDIPASPQFTQQSLTITLSASHYYLSIIPTVSQRLLSGRQYKLFVTVNGVRLMATTREMEAVNGEVNGANSARKQCYDAVLTPGIVNRIEVEVVAVAGRGGALETEKLNVFANILRA